MESCLMEGGLQARLVSPASHHPSPLPPFPDDCRKAVRRGCVMTSSGAEPAASARMSGRGEGAEGMVWIRRGTG